MEEPDIIKTINNNLSIYFFGHAMEDQFPNQGSNPCPLHWKCGVLNISQVSQYFCGRELFSLNFFFPSCEGRQNTTPHNLYLFSIKIILNQKHLKKSKQRGKISLNSYLPTVRHTAIFKIDNQEPTVEHVELFSMLCGSLDGKGVWRRMDTGRCMAKSLRCSPETMTILLISYTHNKK